jgi:hypothetical protein
MAFLTSKKKKLETTENAILFVDRLILGGALNSFHLSHPDLIQLSFPTKQILVLNQNLLYIIEI